MCSCCNFQVIFILIVECGVRLFSKPFKLLWRRGGYSGKSDYLVLRIYLSFNEKPTMHLDLNQKPMKEQSQHKIEVRFELCITKNPHNIFQIILVQILSHVPILQKETTAKFPALGNSHNRPCHQAEFVNQKC